MDRGTRWATAPCSLTFSICNKESGKALKNICDATVTSHPLPPASKQKVKITLPRGEQKCVVIQGQSGDLHGPAVCPGYPPGVDLRSLQFPGRDRNVGFSLEAQLSR